MRRIAIINQKGGVGKTTTTINVGAALARMGQRVLLIDLDPQAHLTLHLGQDPTSGQVGVYEMLAESATVAKARRKVASNLWSCSASIDLAGAEVELVNVVGREVILRDLLDQHLNSSKTPPYDYVLMDCPPSLNILTLNALCAATEVLIPLQPHYLALQGLSKLLETVAVVNKRINPALKVTGVVVCMNESGTRLAGEVIDDVRSFFAEARGHDVPWSDTRVFRTFIRRNIKLAESPSYGKSIFEYAPDSHGAEDYLQLAAELHSPATTTPQEQAVEPAEPSQAQIAVSGPASQPVIQPSPSEPPGKTKPDRPQAPPPGSPGPAERQPHPMDKPAVAHPTKQQQVRKAGIDPALVVLAPATPATAVPRSDQPAKRKSLQSAATAPQAQPAVEREGGSAHGPRPSSAQSAPPRCRDRARSLQVCNSGNTTAGSAKHARTTPEEPQPDAPVTPPAPQPSPSAKQAASADGVSRPAQAV
jgi:chromosome partitioning protein